MGALAGPGPGPHGRRPRRPAPLPSAASTWTRAAATSSGSTWGAAAFSAELDALGIEHVFELFDATHSGIEYRYPTGLAFLAERLGS